MTNGTEKKEIRNMVSECRTLAELGEEINKINSREGYTLVNIEISPSGNHAFVYYTREI